MEFVGHRLLCCSCVTSLVVWFEDFGESHQVGSGRSDQGHLPDIVFVISEEEESSGHNSGDRQKGKRDG